MKSYILLIILDFIHLAFCLLDTNLTEDDLYSVCPVTFWRRKRALTEYTRWRSNIETSPEFILKIDDDELTTSHSKQVVAVNIVPVTKSEEKIIIGGAIIPPLTTSLPISEQPKDYTRFVPPTTLPVTRLEDELFLAPVAVDTSVEQNLPVKAKGLVKNPFPHVNYAAIPNSKRDESPPAPPQFIARTPMIARQYAPVAPVAFARRTTISPLTPPLIETFTIRTTSVKPTQIQTTSKTLTQTVFEFLKTKSSDFEVDNPFIDDDVTSSSLQVTRTALTSKHTPIKTSQIEDKFVENTINFERSTEHIYEDIRRNEDEFQKFLKGSEKDSDSAYNMMFYNDDDIENSSKKESSVESYDEEQFTSVKANTLSENDTDALEIDVATEFRNLSTTFDNDNSELDKMPCTKFNTPILAIDDIDVFTSLKNQKEKSRDKRRPVCNLVKLRQLTFNSPRTLPEIVAQLKQWAEDSPVAKWVDITDGNLTTMENPIYMMIVDDPSRGQVISAKRTVMVVAGIQGRDHYAVAAAMYILFQLIERSDAHTDLLSKYRFWIIPVFNPDGYDYSMTFPHRREWTKNLRQTWGVCKGRDTCKDCETHGIRCTVQPCYGVNLDRNFEYQWISSEELRMEHPCGALYPGTRQLSEPETRALTHFLHEQGTPLFTFISLKEGEVLGVMYPYSHTRKKRAFDHVYRQRASRAATAAYSISGRPYVAGQTSEFLPMYAGGIEDWVDGHLGIDNTYTIMMYRPSDAYNSQLITERVVHEAYAAMDMLLLQSIEPLAPPGAVSLMRAKHGHITLASYWLTFIGISTILILYR